MEQLAALAMLRLDWADSPDHVWHDSPYHVDGLHDDVAAIVDAGVRDAAVSSGPSPIGLVLKGQNGVGKTHLLGLIRRQIHRAGGYFFLNNLTAGDAFWENTADALRGGLSRKDDSGEPQLKTFLRRVCLLAGLNAPTTAAVVGEHGLTRRAVDAFVAGLRALDRQVGTECGDVARALVLYASDSEASQIGHDFLGRFDETRTGERRKWGINPRQPSALRLVGDVTRLLALTGPLVIATDQLDTLVALAAQVAQRPGTDGAESLLVAQVADGLMGLREVTRRTLTVVACLPGAWDRIKAKAASTVPDRFRESRMLGRIKDSEVAQLLVAKRLGVAYHAMGYRPPHATWPVADSAFDQANWEERTPRDLWKRIWAHLELCLRNGVVAELTTFDEAGAWSASPVQPVREPYRFADLDERFHGLRQKADVSMLLDQRSEGAVTARLVSNALRTWVMEEGDDEMRWSHGIENGGRSESFARLTLTVDEAADLKEHWDFRAIFASHHIAVLHRLRRALGAADAYRDADNQHLVIVRNSEWSKGEKTQQELRRFHAAGGRCLALPEEDVRTFWALGEMFVDAGTELHEWLVERRPAGRSALLSAVRASVPTMAPTSSASANGTHPPPAATPIDLGVDSATGDPVRIELSALRKHIAVFAGSGSGKTVLLRRIVEECALRGVSAIVLDPNNDLARLGDAWPESPPQWGPGDADLAKRYLAETDVVVWTPGRSAGRPLAFQPLPDFAGVLDDEDEFAAAVEVALAALAPQARLTGNTAKSNIGLAVLRQAVVHYARGGSRSLPELIEVLADLPDDVSTLNDARRIAAELAEVLKAAMVNDPLLAGGGPPVDPGVLLTPAAGKSARVSVISFIGLAAEEQRQNFVNQLQMELFGWLKRHPAGDRPLGALFVMDEAQTMAASGSLSASARSTIVLASQARKYGLGLLFATQAPKGLHNQIVGNATTQFFGRLNSPVQIAAATELARAKGGAVADISGLERAQFYVSGESSGLRRTIVPLCLSHHPAGPLRLEEVLERARRNR
jgi:hypothetical protein